LEIIGAEYTPKYAGEEFYMPFNTNFGDLVSGSNATEVGTPGLAGEGKVSQPKGSGTFCHPAVDQNGVR
jgi:hypothetical protein